MDEIDSEKLKRMEQLHVRFLIFDIRSAEDYAAGHIKNAFHIPAGEFLDKILESVKTKDTPIVVYGQTGDDSIGLVEQVEKLGYLNVVNLTGGYQGYATSGRSS